MIREYIRDKWMASRIQLDDPILQKIIQYKHWDKLEDDDLMKKIGLSERELKIYLAAYIRLSRHVCF